VDFSALVDENGGSGIQVTQGTVWFDLGNPTYKCGAKLNISGTDDNGTFEITYVNSGSASYNAAYCNQITGTYEYAAVAGDGYRITHGPDVYWY
jgi:hypothetical protein